MFPAELSVAAATLPFEVRCAVTPPSVAQVIGVTAPQLGEVLLFSGERLLGRIAADIPDKRDRLLGLLTAGIAPWLGKRGQPDPEFEYEHEGIDPFAVIGVPATAAFDEVHAAWRQKLSEYHPDRFMRAGEKIRQLANTETQRLNAAFQAIARERSASRRS
jgi:DnaJ-domain-containing protein 1